jgi:hypothetical protein
LAVGGTGWPAPLQNRAAIFGQDLIALYELQPGLLFFESFWRCQPAKRYAQVSSG